jgi:hypothetical protein
MRLPICAKCPACTDGDLRLTRYDVKNTPTLRDFDNRILATYREDDLELTCEQCEASINIKHGGPRGRVNGDLPIMKKAQEAWNKRRTRTMPNFCEHCGYDDHQPDHGRNCPKYSGPPDVTPEEVAELEERVEKLEARGQKPSERIEQIAHELRARFDAPGVSEFRLSALIRYLDEEWERRNG